MLDRLLPPRRLVEARCTHQGYTFLEFTGRVTGVVEDPAASTPSTSGGSRVPRGGRRREELRLPAARRARHQHQRHRGRGDPRRRARAPRRARGTRTPSCWRSASSCRRAWCAASSRPREIALARRARPRSRSGRTATPSAARAGPGSAAVPASSTDAAPRSAYPQKNRRSGDLYVTRTPVPAPAG